MFIVALSMVVEYTMVPHHFRSPPAQRHPSSVVPPITLNAPPVVVANVHRLQSGTSVNASAGQRTSNKLVNGTNNAITVHASIVQNTNPRKFHIFNCEQVALSKINSMRISRHMS